MGKRMTVTREDFDKDLMPPQIGSETHSGFFPRKLRGKTKFGA
jgi:hypothetical protein